MNDTFLFLKNSSATPLENLPNLRIAEFRTALLDRINGSGARLSAFFATPDGGNFRLFAVLASPSDGGLLLTSSTVERSYPALTPDCHAFFWFEREIAEQYGIIPEGHPHPAPIRFQSREEGAAPDGRFPGASDGVTLSGDAAHEVAVGPVHAGVIEPGHFRFQCMGEDVYSLEISLGYQHRGIERLIEGGPNHRTIHYMETAAGDTSVAAALNYSLAMEALCGLTVSEETTRLRRIALELERSANHIGDLGALAGDAAFLPTASFCGRIRGEYLNMTAELAGNRFGRGLIVPGGTRFSLDAERARKIGAWIARVAPDWQEALDLMFDSPTVLDRLENTGSVDCATARRIGMVGVAGRASGLTCDVRRDFPSAATPETAVEFHGNGDVYARAAVRYAELRASDEFLRLELEKAAEHPAEALPDAGTQLHFNPAPNAIAVSLTEAWRGELCTVLLTDAAGTFRRVKIVDPSFHNWFGLALALRGEQISNFPICNKSFNLSYAGHDL